MGLGNDTWDMPCALRPIYAASGCGANGHYSLATPSQLTGNYRLRIQLVDATHL
jgi:hypothetical protein